MLYETKIKQGKFTEIWEEMIQDNWDLVYFSEEHLVSFWKKKIPKNRTIKVGVETKEWLEFIKLYREINKNGSYDKTLIAKYEKVLKENKHSDIIDNLKTYKEHLILFPSKPPLQVGTYLNRNRFKDDWELVKINYSEKWIIDTMKDRGIDESHQDRILTAARVWRKSYEPVKEFTSTTLDMMINKIWENKDYS